MTTGVIGLHAAALLCYLAAAVLYGANLTLQSTASARVARLFYLAGFAVQTAAIGLYCVDTQQSPFASGFGTLSVAAWAVALLYVPGELRLGMPALAALVLPVSCLLLFAGIARWHGALATAPIIRNRIVSLHVLLILFSFALFALAACCAVLFVWQYGLLKRPRQPGHAGRAGLFRRLPPLQTVDSLAYHLVAFALPLLTLGLALGMVRAAGLPGNWLTDPKTIVSFVAWLVYGLFLTARLVAGWRGTRLHYLLIAGMVVTLALYFVPSASHHEWTTAQSGKLQ